MQENMTPEFQHIEAPKGEESDVEKMKHLVEQEKEKASERFAHLIETVSSRYESLPEKVREDFISHNAEILEGAIELAIRNGFSERETVELELAAILHDMTKADKAPEGYEDIPQYTLVMHGLTASQEARRILTDDELGMNFVKSEPGSFDEIRETVSRAILEHMGPRPGFMSGMIEGVNKKLRERGEKEIEYPEAHGKVSEALLAADMKSLAGIKGREKVLSIRSNVEFFKKQDEGTAVEYSAHGIELTPSEAALLSGFKSAEEARDMITNEDFKAWIDDAIKGSLGYEYDLGGAKVSGHDVMEKKRRFDEAKLKRVVH